MNNQIVLWAVVDKYLTIHAAFPKRIEAMQKMCEIEDQYSIFPFEVVQIYVDPLNQPVIISGQV